MGQPAARVGDMHMCPMVTPGLPPIPHVGGPVLPPGVPTVWIGGMPAATMGSMCVCVGPPDSIIRGSFTVLIGGRPAARMGDNTAHGGIIVMGCPTVLIGEFGMGMPTLDFIVAEGVAIFRKIEGMTQNWDRYIKVPEVDPGVVAQIQTGVAAARSGSPFMDKC